MKQLLQNQKSGKLRIEDVPAPVARPGGVIVRNDYSVVSAGTERATVGFARQGMIGKARARPDLVRQVLKRVRTDGLRSTYRSVMSRLDLDTPLGYSTAGEVVEIGAGVDAVSPGDMVACAGAGYASHAEVIYVPRNLVVKLPQGVSTRDGSFATIGAIAMQGVRRAELTPGETVVVIGLGLLGQITVQILRAYGFPIMGVDIDAEKVEMAGSRGIEAAGVIGRGDLEQIAYRLEPEGIDDAIITAATKTSEP
ncbi:MAG: zinc-binding alcohol dehydrogenase, partial [Chloroflexi bacterium]|nr:zinc-binding alcohol dehydrogenase [Chloroflexota bacterium]